MQALTATQQRQILTNGRPDWTPQSIEGKPCPRCGGVDACQTPSGAGARRHREWRRLRTALLSGYKIEGRRVVLL